jgi:integrase
MSENTADKRPTIPVLREEPNGFYYAFWSEGRRSRRKSMGTKDQAVATARFAQWLLIDGAGKGNEVDYTVADCWLVYDTKHVQTDAVMPNGKVTIRSAWKHLEPALGLLLVPQIDQGQVDKYVANRRRAGAAPATVRIEISYLLAALKFCATSKGGKLISKADIEDIELPPNSPPRDRWLTMDEVQKLLDAAATFRLADGRLTRTERFLWLALFTAAREEALLQLTWDRVDFTTNTIHLNVPGRRITKKRRADVTIATQLRPVLERAYKERQG